MYLEWIAWEHVLNAKWSPHHAIAPLIDRHSSGNTATSLIAENKWSISLKQALLNYYYFVQIFQNPYQNLSLQFTGVQLLAPCCYRLFMSAQSVLRTYKGCPTILMKHFGITRHLETSQLTPRSVNGTRGFRQIHTVLGQTFHRCKQTAKGGCQRYTVRRQSMEKKHSSTLWGISIYIRWLQLKCGLLHWSEHSDRNVGKTNLSFTRWNQRTQPFSWLQLLLVSQGQLGHSTFGAWILALLGKTLNVKELNTTNSWRNRTSECTAYHTGEPWI